MVKNVTINHSTLYTGFLLITTISALNSVMAESIQNNISVILILAVGSLFYFLTNGSFCFGICFRLCNRVGDQQLFLTVNKTLACIIGRCKGLRQVDGIFR